MSVSFEGAIASYYSQAIQMQQTCAQKMTELNEALEKDDTTLAGKKKEHCELLLRLSAQIRDSYAQTATQLGELQTLSAQGKIDELKNLLDVSFFIKQKQFDLIQREMKGLSDENKRLREHNQELLSGLTQAGKVIATGPWRVIRDGLNLEGNCENEACMAHGKKVVIQVGIGIFNIGKLAYSSRCPCCAHPVKKVESLLLQNCIYSLDGVDLNEVSQEVKDHKVPDKELLRFSFSSWKYLNLEVKINH